MTKGMVYGGAALDLQLAKQVIVMLLKVLGMLALGTFIIAAALFDLRIVGVAAAAAFLVAVLINLPFLLRSQYCENDSGGSALFYQFWRSAQVLDPRQ